MNNLSPAAVKKGPTLLRNITDSPVNPVTKYCHINGNVIPIISIIPIHIIETDFFPAKKAKAIGNSKL